MSGRANNDGSIGATAKAAGLGTRMNQVIRRRDRPPPNRPVLYGLADSTAAARYDG
jgi:hypothetical protein